MKKLLTGPELLREATILKKKKKYNEACDKLIEAYSAKGYLDYNYCAPDAVDEPSITDRLRFPMYLQLSNRSKEGWIELNRLNKTYTEVIEQPHISKQMRIFLNKEKRHHLAVVYGAWNICTEIQSHRFYISKLEYEADMWVTLEMPKEKKKTLAYTKKGNPVTSSLYSIIINNIEQKGSLFGIKKTLRPLLKKAKLLNELDRISSSLFEYINVNKEYDFSKVSVISFSKKQ